MGFLALLAEWMGLRKQEAHILVIGLDNSGKTTIINRLKPSAYQSRDIVPTLGFNVEKFKLNSLRLTCFDMAGQTRYRDIWEKYYRDCQAIIFVVDSSDRLRMSLAKEELNLTMSHSDIKNRNIPLLVLSNKMDQRDSLSSIRCSELLDLESLENTSWYICSTNALTGDGVDDGIRWLTDQVKSILEDNKK